MLVRELAEQDRIVRDGASDALAGICFTKYVVIIVHQLLFIALTSVRRRRLVFVLLLETLAFHVGMSRA